MTDDFRQKLAALAGPEKQCMEFLAHTLPISDLDCYPFELFLQFCTHALMLREKAPWCRALEEDVFLHYVLFPRVNDEDLSFHRDVFYGELWPRVQELPLREAVLEANRWSHETAGYQQQDDRTASPLTVYRCGSGRCGEESAFVVAALRSVGIPARQVYAPKWSHCDDNHAWVEALCDGEWVFFGACEAEPVLNRGWFNTAASRAVLQHSRLFTRTLSAAANAPHGSTLDATGALTHFNQTHRYAHTKEYTFTVTRGGAPAAGAALALQVLNTAALLPVARFTLPPDGTITVELGIGDIWLEATDGLGGHAEALVHGAQEGGAQLELAPFAVHDEWKEFDFLAPADAPVNHAPLTDEQKQNRRQTIEACSAKRTARIENLFSTQRAATLPTDEAQALLREARGNFDEIFAFLTQDDDPLRLLLLQTLAAKDLRDTTAAVLEDHLQGAKPFAEQYPEEVFAQWVLCPRVAWEKLTAWRTPLRAAYGRKGADTAPAALWRSLLADMEATDAGVHPGLYWPPEQALAAARCNECSLRVLFVALLRSMGVPARLAALDGAPEYWQNGGFVRLSAFGTANAVLHLTQNGPDALLHRQNWSLARWINSGWQTLNADGAEGNAGLLSLALPAGHYRLLTAARLPGGSQFAAQRSFALAAGEEKTIPVLLRGYRMQDMLIRRALPPFAAELAGGVPANLSPRPGRCSLLVLLEEGAEPTEHLLNEMMEGWHQLQDLPLDIRFFLRGPEALEQATLAQTLTTCPGITTLFGNWGDVLETLARHLYEDPDSPPLAIVQDDAGNAVYATSGYRVGSVELMAGIVQHLSQKRG